MHQIGDELFVKVKILKGPDEKGNYRVIDEAFRDYWLHESELNTDTTGSLIPVTKTEELSNPDFFADTNPVEKVEETPEEEAPEDDRQGGIDSLIDASILK